MWTVKSEVNGGILFWEDFHKRASGVNIGKVHPASTVLGKDGLTLVLKVSLAVQFSRSVVSNSSQPHGL